jgi:hypothetical protein
MAEFSTCLVQLRAGKLWVACRARRSDPARAAVSAPWLHTDGLAVSRGVQAGVGKVRSCKQTAGCSHECFASDDFHGSASLVLHLCSLWRAPRQCARPASCHRERVILREDPGCRHMKAKGHLFPRIAPIVVLGRVDTDTGCGRRECCICSVARLGGSGTSSGVGRIGVFCTSGIQWTCAGVVNYLSDCACNALQATIRLWVIHFYCVISISCMPCIGNPYNSWCEHETHACQCTQTPTSSELFPHSTVYVPAYVPKKE